MPDEIRRVRQTLAELQRLVVRFELDTTTRLQVVDYQHAIYQLCEQFDRQLRELMRPQREVTDQVELQKDRDLWRLR
jgi:hypothetical protein